MEGLFRLSQCASKAMVAAAAPSPAPAPAQAPKAASSKAGDRKVVVPVTAAEVELLEEKHVLAVDGSSVDRAVIAKILRSSMYRGEPSHPFQPNFQRV